MVKTTTKLRQLIQEPGIIVSPVAYDPLSARIAEQIGFRCISLGGYAMGSHLAVSEPLMGLKDVTDLCRNITSAVDIPLVVDAGAGFGEPAHIVRTVRDFERAGVAGIHIEDQFYPKRVHYHKGVEHTVSAEEFLMKIEYAVQSRTDPDFVIIARTDTMRTESFEEGVRRSNDALAAGADMVMVFPNNREEAKWAPKLIHGPVVYVNSSGNRANRPLFTVQQLDEMGYKMDYDAISAINVASQAVYKLFKTLYETGDTGLDQEEMIRVRKQIEDTIGLDEYYTIEERTVEGGGK
ncbi:MAG TPA: isocitrate lyase/PEP mutase family protein [Bacillales bacterium]|nr:isocitrate lyase/PEP mutase family protein [Bacillales bacterium]